MSALVRQGEVKMKGAARAQEALCRTREALQQQQLEQSWAVAWSLGTKQLWGVVVATAVKAWQGVTAGQPRGAQSADWGLQKDDVSLPNT